MKDKKPRVGLVMKSLNADFSKDMQKGAEDYACSTGCCELVCAGTDTQTEIERQIALVDSGLCMRFSSATLISMARQ